MVPESGAESLVVSEKIPCYGIKGLDILERRAFRYYMEMVWYKVFLIALYISISVNIVYMGSIIR